MGHGDRFIVPAEKKKRDKIIRIDKEAKEERNCDGTVVITL